MPAPPSSSAPQHPNFLTTVLNPPAPAPPFSAAQRSLQARNKAYNNHGAASAASAAEKEKEREEAESYEVRQRREEAGRILEREEMLIWWSQARNEVRFYSLFLRRSGAQRLD
jgi:hypothetical protein